MLHSLSRTFGFVTFLVKRLLELMHHDLEILNVFNIELGHVLLELSLFVIDLMLQLNNFLRRAISGAMAPWKEMLRQLEAKDHQN